jgi:hypothetical protein
MSSLQSSVIVSRLDLDVPGTHDQTIYFDQPTLLNPNKRHWVRVMRALVSKQIPNVYTDPITGVSNTTLRITRDNGATWSVVTLSPGIYSAEGLSLAIQQYMIDNSWVAAASPEAIQVVTNTVVLLNYVILDSSLLLAPGTVVGIDFSNNGTSILGTTFGFTPTTQFIGTQTTAGSSYPIVARQGTQVDITTNLGTSIRSINSSATQVICTVTFSGGTLNEYVFPNDGVVSPLIPVALGSSIRSLTVSFKTPDGTEMYFLSGLTELQIEIIEEF